MCDSQVDPHTLAVVSRVRPDAIHVQLPRHLQQVDVRVSWRYTSTEREREMKCVKSAPILSKRILTISDLGLYLCFL